MMKAMVLEHPGAALVMTDLPDRQPVANLTRQDGLDFLSLAPRIGIVTHTTRYPLSRANEALADLGADRFEGAAVLVPERVD